MTSSPSIATRARTAPDGSLCCRTYDCSGGCPPKLACEQTQCLTEIAEACLPGGKCEAGFSCRIEPGQDQGVCMMDCPGVTCGSKRCEGKTPVCRWERAAEKGTCVADSAANADTPNDDVAWLGCATSRDCAGYACGKMADMPTRNFFCATPGFAGDRFFPILCGKRGRLSQALGRGRHGLCVPQGRRGTELRQGLRVSGRVTLSSTSPRSIV